MNTIHERISFLRGNLNQQEFADKLGIALNTYRSYEKGSTPPNLAFIKSVVANLNVNLDWFIFGEGEMLSKAKPTNATLDELKAEIGELENELKQERQQNRKLTDQLLNNISKDSNKNHEQTA